MLVLVLVLGYPSARSTCQTPLQIGLRPRPPLPPPPKRTTTTYVAPKSLYRKGSPNIAENGNYTIQCKYFIAKYIALQSSYI